MLPTVVMRVLPFKCRGCRSWLCCPKKCSGVQSQQGNFDRPCFGCARRWLWSWKEWSPLCIEGKKWACVCVCVGVCRACISSTTIGGGAGQESNSFFLLYCSTTKSTFNHEVSSCYRWNFSPLEKVLLGCIRTLNFPFRWANTMFRNDRRMPRAVAGGEHERKIQPFVTWVCS